MIIREKTLIKMKEAPKSTPTTNPRGRVLVYI